MNSSPQPRPAGGRPAAFLDRDGTLVEDPGFLREVGAVRLLPGAAAAVSRLNAAGLVVVVVTNQSGIARGLITPAEYAAIELRVGELFLREGARIDRTYHCPHFPSIDGHCECRKPGTLLYRKAANDFGLDLGASWAVGDRLSDLEPLQTLGGRAVLVRTGTGQEFEKLAAAAGFPIADGVGEAVDRILGPLGVGRAP